MKEQAVLRTHTRHFFEHSKVVIMCTCCLLNRYIPIFMANNTKTIVFSNFYFIPNNVQQLPVTEVNNININYIFIIYINK